MNTLNEYATAGEARAARKLVKAALAAGYTISVNDGEEWTVKRSTSAKAIIDALATTDSDRLLLRDPADGEAIGSFWLIYGNDPSGDELISDHSDNNVCNALYRAAYRVKTTI
jgi:hypothetical protein